MTSIKSTISTTTKGLGNGLHNFWMTAALEELLLCIIGPFIGAVLFLLSPIFINVCEQQAGRWKLFKDCWLNQFEPQKIGEYTFDEMHNG